MNTKPTGVMQGVKDMPYGANGTSVTGVKMIPLEILDPLFLPCFTRSAFSLMLQ